MKTIFFIVFGIIATSTNVFAEERIEQPENGWAMWFTVSGYSQVVGNNYANFKDENECLRALSKSRVIGFTQTTVRLSDEEEQTLGGVLTCIPFGSAFEKPD